MFEATGLRGRILHQVLHKQHQRVYIYDKETDYGNFNDGPGDEMTKRFLDMVHYDEGGRIFTYVITLDGMFRFTETGKEFGIDLLSKHTMHSDVNVSVFLILLTTQLLYLLISPLLHHVHHINES